MTDEGLRVRAVGWLALVLLGFSIASFAVELNGPQQVFYELRAPFGPIPAMLWVALVAALWLLSRRTPGAPLALASAALWLTGYGLGSMPLKSAFIAMMCWALAPVVLGAALLRGGFGLPAWGSCLAWGGATVIGVALSYAAIVLHSAMWSDVGYVILTLGVPVLRWFFLGTLAVLLLRQRGPAVRLTSASS